MTKDRDPVNDGSVAWPAGRELIELGTVSLNNTPVEQAKAQKTLLFNPLLLQPRIEPSADPVLLARPGVYAVSYDRRVQ